MSEREAVLLAIRTTLVDIFWEKGAQDFNKSSERVLGAIEQVQRDFEYAR